MTDKKPIVIQRGSFVCTLDDVEHWMALPLANIRKLWKIMFLAEGENVVTIQIIRDWFPQILARTEGAIPGAQAHYKEAQLDAEALHHTLAAFGSAAGKEQKLACKKANATLCRAEKSMRAIRMRYDRAKKLQTMFNDLSKN